MWGLFYVTMSHKDPGTFNKQDDSMENILTPGLLTVAQLIFTGCHELWGGREKNLLSFLVNSDKVIPPSKNGNPYNGHINPYGN